MGGQFIPGAVHSATDFEPQRFDLQALTYCMQGSRSEAEDAVQDPWLRWIAALIDLNPGGVADGDTTIYRLDGFLPNAYVPSPSLKI